MVWHLETTLVRRRKRAGPCRALLLSRLMGSASLLTVNTWSMEPPGGSLPNRP